MTNTIFHVTVATLVGAMAVAGVAIAMAPADAQSSRKTDWSDLLKPYAAKTNPAVPIAPSATPTQSITPATKSNPIVDGCVISAIGRLPKADGLRVTNSSYEFRNPNGSMFDFYTVSISVDLHGRQATYQWLCRVYQNSSAELLRMP
jgi:spermidine/putrescine-binding protein